MERKKILHVSNFVQRHLGRLHANICFKISNGLTRLGHNVLNFSDRDVARNNFLQSSLVGRRHVNQALIQVFRDYLPDLVVLGHADLIEPETLLTLRDLNPSCRFIQWYIDNLAIDNNLQKLQKIAPIDHLFLTTGDPLIQELLQPGMSVTFLPNLFDRSIETRRIFENCFYDFDVFFAMSHGVGRGTLKQGKVDAREAFLRAIQKDSEILTDFYGMDGRQPLWGDEIYRQMNRSPMGINLNRGKPLALYSSDRISMYIGSGFLTFLDRASQCEPLFADDEVAYYDDVEHLIDLIKYYKKHKDVRVKMANKAWARGHEAFDGTLLCQYMLQKTYGEPLSPIAFPEVTYR